MYVSSNYITASLSLCRVNHHWGKMKCSVFILVVLDISVNKLCELFYNVLDMLGCRSFDVFVGL